MLQLNNEGLHSIDRDLHTQNRILLYTMIPLSVLFSDYFLLDDFSLWARALPAMLFVLALDLPSLRALEALLATLADVTLLGIYQIHFVEAISSLRYTNIVCLSHPIDWIY